MWQARRSCSLRVQRTSTRRPRMEIPRVACAKEVPKEKSPKTHRRSGDCSAEKASDGQSTNLGKAARNEAFAWYSLSTSSSPPEAGKGSTRVVSSAKKTKPRIRFSTEKRLFGSRRRESRPTPSPANRRGKHTKTSIADIVRP